MRNRQELRRPGRDHHRVLGRLRAAMTTLVPALGLALVLVVFGAVSATPTRHANGILTDTGYIYGSEIGTWQTTGGPILRYPRLVRAAAIPVIRYAEYDCFRDESAALIITEAARLGPTSTRQSRESPMSFTPSCGSSSCR